MISLGNRVVKVLTLNQLQEERSRIQIRRNTVIKECHTRPNVQNEWYVLVYSCSNTCFHAL
jgi:hypothetical protein